LWNILYNQRQGGFKVKKSQEIFKRHGYEPLALKAHDSRLLIGGYTPKVACRVVAEALFQALIDEVDRERDGTVDTEGLAFMTRSDLLPKSGEGE
jgi:hypothetical protein